MKPVPLLGAFALGAAVASVVANGRLPGWFPKTEGAHIAGSAVSTASPAATESPRCLDEAEMRRVIREEIVAAPAANVPTQSGLAQNPAEIPPVPVASPAEVALVNSQLDRYIQAGVISNSEMARLQSEIGKLDPAARHAAMQKLVRAMNSGALDGRL
jgi:hypothetical protein